MSSVATGPAARLWDFIVIGTGMGGATIGHRLARMGHSVLFCESGRSYLTAPDVLAGDWLDVLTGGKPGTPEQLKRAGRWSADIFDVTSGQHKHMRPVLGIGTGGSSALYGMVLERFFPSDFAPRQYYRDCPEANIPETWPIGYDDLAPYFHRSKRSTA